MKLLTVNWRDIRNPLAGGAEVHLHEIQRRLADAGHAVVQLATSFDGAAPEETVDGVRVVRRGGEYNANFVLRRAARRLLAEGDFDAVVEDINKIPFFLPTVTRLPVLGVVPHLFGTTVFRETNPLFALYVWFWEWWIPWVYRRARFMAISPSTKDDLVARRIPAERIEVVYCGLDGEVYSRAKKPERFPDPTVIHLGRLRRYKSVDVAIRAFELVRARLPRARMIVVGDGPDRPRLEKLVRRAGLERSVSFPGYLPQGEKVDLLHRVHVCLNPSPKEGWGLTVIEASACGVPVVASRRPGLRDSVRHGETGFLVPYGDPGSFAERTLELLGDLELRDRMGENAIAYAASFSWDEAARRTLEILGTLVGESRGDDGR
jgi:glycosyltransferase involved in cell wall biosynthesis